MYAEIVAVAGLAVAANAMPGAPPAYAASSSAPVGPVSSAPVWSGSASASGPVYSGSGSASASYSYSGSYSASASYSAPVPSGSAYPSCWSACFAAAGISSESALCGNTEVDACIQDSCSPAEDKAYWAWYESYCPATTSPVVTPTAPTAPVYSASSVVVTSPIPTASYPACWSACFAQNDVTSEAELCGDDAVSQCIYETCDSAADQAYWAWYEGYCTGAATVTSVVTLTSPCVESGATTWASTAWTPAGPPATSPAAPYPTGATSGAWGSQTATVPAATGTGVWPSGSTGWPVPATGGASVVAQSGFALLAGFLGLVALL